MESLGRTRSFMKDLLSVVWPNSVALKFKKKLPATEGQPPKDSYSIIKLQTGCSPARSLAMMIDSGGSMSEQKVYEVEIVTTPGTIRKHSKSYKRKAAKTVSFMGMNIDILPPLRGQKKDLQQVTLTPGRLHREGGLTPTLPMDALRKEWHENPNSPKPTLPRTSPAYIQGLARKNRIHDKAAKKYGIAKPKSI